MSAWDSAQAAERVARAYAAPDLAAVRERQIDLLAPQPGWRIADIGCGPGAFAEGLSARGAQVTAIDSAPAMLAATGARELGCELVEADALSLPLASGSHDAACLVQVLEYVPDPVAALREAARIVRPGGVVLAADTDWDTQGFNVSDRGLGRRVVQRLGGRQARRLGGSPPARLADGGRPRAGGALRARARRDGVGRRHVHRAQLAAPSSCARDVRPRVRRRSCPLRGRDRGVGRERGVLLERRAPRLARAGSY